MTPEHSDPARASVNIRNEGGRGHVNNKPPSQRRHNQHHDGGRGRGQGRGRGRGRGQGRGDHHQQNINANCINRQCRDGINCTSRDCRYTHEGLRLIDRKDDQRDDDPQQAQQHPGVTMTMTTVEAFEAQPSTATGTARNAEPGGNNRNNSSSNNNNNNKNTNNLGRQQRSGPHGRRKSNNNNNTNNNNKTDMDHMVTVIQLEGTSGPNPKDSNKNSGRTGGGNNKKNNNPKMDVRQNHHHQQQRKQHDGMKAFNVTDVTQDNDEGIPRHDPVHTTATIGDKRVRKNGDHGHLSKQQQKKKSSNDEKIKVQSQFQSQSTSLSRQSKNRNRNEESSKKVDDKPTSTQMQLSKTTSTTTKQKQQKRQQDQVQQKHQHKNQHENKMQEGKTDTSSNKQCHGRPKSYQRHVKNRQFDKVDNKDDVVPVAGAVASSHDETIKTTRPARATGKSINEITSTTSPSASIATRPASRPTLKRDDNAKEKQKEKALSEARAKVKREEEEEKARMREEEEQARMREEEEQARKREEEEQARKGEEEEQARKREEEEQASKREEEEQVRKREVKEQARKRDEEEMSRKREEEEKAMAVTREKERLEEEERKKRWQAELQRQREVAAKKKDEKKQKKAARFHEIQQQKQDEEEARVDFWSNQIETERKAVDFVVQLSSAEFCRQHGGEHFTRHVVQHLGRDELLVQARKVVYKLFRDEFVTAVETAGTNDGGDGRHGTIQYWDDVKSQFCVALDNKKGNAGQMQLRFINPSNLTARNDAPQDGKGKKGRSHFHEHKQHNINTDYIRVDALVGQYDLSSFPVKRSTIQKWLSTTDGSVGDNIDWFLDVVMQERDMEELEDARMRQKMEAEEAAATRRRAEKKRAEQQKHEERRRQYQEEKQRYKEWKRDFRRASHRENQSRFFHDFDSSGRCRGADFDGIPHGFPGAFPGGGFFFSFGGASGFFFSPGGLHDDYDEDYYDRHWEKEMEEERQADLEKYADLLGVSVDSPREVIKKQYRLQARKYHPDMHVGKETQCEAEEKFKEIQNAYDGLVTALDDNQDDE